MNKYGFEHLRFSNNTYKQRRILLIIGCIAVLIFEYNITNDLKFYNISIPNSLLKFGIIVSAIWTTIQFIFSSVDDFIEWKKIFLLDEKLRPNKMTGDRTIIIEIESFSRGKIKYNPQFGHAYGETDRISDFQKIETGLKSNIERLEQQLKVDVSSIEQFKKWYKFFSWFTIIRFTILEFSLPLLFILYATVICQYFPIFPK